jgi:hypothetical protein
MYSGLINIPAKTKKMERNSKLPGKCITLITVVTFFFFYIVQVQTEPIKFKFANPALAPGNVTQKHATKKLSDIITQVNAFVKMAEIKNSTRLVNIDDS